MLASQKATVVVLGALDLSRHLLEVQLVFLQSHSIPCQVLKYLVRFVESGVHWSGKDAVEPARRNVMDSHVLSRRDSPTTTPHWLS
jgi:hypothetical protein